MSQTPLPRPSSKPRDFKARFGVVPDAPPPKMTRLQARRAKRQRFRVGAVIFALLLGTAAGGTFLIAQDYQGVASFFKSRIAGKDGPATSPPVAPPVEKKEVAAAPPPPAAPAAAPAPAAVAPPSTPPVETQAAATPEIAASPSPPAAEAPADAPTPVAEVPAAVAEPPQQQAPAIAPPPEQIAEAPVVEEPPVAAAAAPQPAAEAPVVVPETQTAPPAEVAAEAPAAAVEPVQPAPPPPQPVTEAMQFPGSPVVSPDGGVPAATVTANETAAVETVTQQGQSVPLEEASPPAQVAMAAPPAAVPVVGSGNGAALVQGQVFRDCENCPDLVVVVPPAGLPAEQLARVKRPADAPPLQAFAIGRFEITFDDWARCMAGGGCTGQPGDEGWGRNTRPVINVSYEDATTQYIAWLSQVTGTAYRLPSATEWDFAEAGGGVTPASGVPLIDAQTVCQSGNYIAAPGSAQEASCADGFPTTAPVGSLKANALGLNDMRGNVWEWVSDCWTPGFTYKVKDSERDCRKHLLRGGSWSSRALLSSTPARGFEDAKRASKTIGFRVARALP